MVWNKYALQLKAVWQNGGLSSKFNGLSSIDFYAKPNICA